MSSSSISQKKLADSLSIAEKLDVVLAYTSILGNTFFSLLTGIWRTRNEKRGSYKRYVLLTAVRTMYHAYETVCKQRGVEPLSETLEDGTQAHWIGKKGAKKIILNFHGGGFALPASPEAVEYMFRLVDGAENEGKSLAVLFLSYAGDSAGANLVLALLSHIMHGHPNDSIPRVRLSKPLDGAVLLAPWVTFATGSQSYEANKYKDLIHPTSVKIWAGDYQASAPSDNYIEPLYASSSWWSRLPTVVSSILIVAGEDEAFVDDVKAFADNLQKVGTETDGVEIELFVVENEYHDQPNFGFGEDCLEKKGSQGWEIGNWVWARC
ncbi:putative alpha beta hydrolase fold protein [Botrytis fragariae]|uniref:Putative alpha beta hydrolase fold protein n=1 Tax=Botrytis fragariae TaxID=1964551 RepID=A0A8H6B697_9HELO|nr:putative alpha beta hydrolase fold protein [Botrytis fragariae]KAF5879742.1 putative alpha beta hydrolase fold protein [Botrytis fragariae]